MGTRAGPRVITLSGIPRTITLNNDYCYWLVVSDCEVLRAFQTVGRSTTESPRTDIYRRLEALFGKPLSESGAFVEAIEVDQLCVRTVTGRFGEVAGESGHREE